MKESKQVPLMLSVPKKLRDKLRTMAAEQNFKDPDQVTSASTIAREILCDHLSIIANDLEAKQCQNRQNNAA